MIARIEIECLDCSETFECEVEVAKEMHAVITEKIEKSDWLYTRIRDYDGYRCPECAERGIEADDNEPSDWRQKVQESEYGREACS